MKPFLSIREASEYLGLEYKTVYRLVRAGEIPAARLGGVYRIKLADLEDYFEQQKQRVLSHTGVRQDTLLSSPETLHCGRCLRVIHNKDQVAGQCAASECGASLCQVCWMEDKARYCSRHEPSWDEKLRRALDDHAAGRAPAPITTEQARRMELAYLGRFDHQTRELKSVRHPATGKAIQIEDWAAIHEYQDDTARIRQLGLRADSSQVAEKLVPLNGTSIYTVARPNRQQTGLVLSASCFAHLECFLRSGIDTAPASLSELVDLLQVCIRTAESRNSNYMCAYASPTGWTAEAIEYIGAGQRSSVFHHRLVLPFLVDLAKGKIFRDRLDARLSVLEPLFLPLLRHEQVERARTYVAEQLLSRHRSLTAKDVADQLGLPPDVVQEACRQLGKDERFFVDEIKDVGLVMDVR
ncbi:MAG: helix-turn-helix domain-containing protein [Chloroflexi bacterium]|nr:helix-turn-helix domain-containing protein [Chloroflexota bacterium]